MRCRPPHACIHLEKFMYPLALVSGAPHKAYIFRFNTPTINTFPASGTHTCLILRGYPPLVPIHFWQKVRGLTPPLCSYIIRNVWSTPPAPEPVGVGDFTPLWCEAHFEVKMLKALHARTIFKGSDVFLRGRRTGFCILPKVSKTWGFCSMSKNDGRHGTFEEDPQRCIFRGWRSTRDKFIRAVRRSGRWFPERGCILEHQIFRFAEMMLRDRCSTSCGLAFFFVYTFDRWSRKIANGMRPSVLHSTFHFGTKSRRIVLFLMLSISKIEEVWQNCFVFDVVNFKNWGGLAESLRFWCCQVQNLRRSRRITSISSLQIDR